MSYNDLIFRVHALERMFERSVSVGDIQHVLTVGDLLETYPKDVPYPSYLVLGFARGRALHVVAADNVQAKQTIIITVYEPDPKRWGSDFKRRRK